MTEFYKWAASDFGSFLLITGVIVFGMGCDRKVEGEAMKIMLFIMLGLASFGLVPVHSVREAVLVLSAYLFGGLVMYVIEREGK